MDVKEIVELGGLVELTAPLIIFLRAAEVYGFGGYTDEFLVVMLGPGAQLKITQCGETIGRGSAGPIVGEIVAPGRALVVGTNEEVGGIEGLDFLTGHVDLSSAIQFIDKKEESNGSTDKS